MTGDNKSIFLFSYFKGHGDGLHLAWSGDGFHWTPLNDDQPFLTPQVGVERLMRDPFLLLGQDGLFHLVWTSDWHGTSIGYGSSSDLREWPQQKLLNVMEQEKGTRNCIYWASSVPGRFPESDHSGDDGLNHRMYFVTTPDFETFTQAKLFFDPGFNVIDASLAKDGHRYVMFMKDETLNPCQKNIRVAVSEDIFGGFKSVGPPITGAYWAEGPTAVRINGEWIVYFDKYKLNRIGAVRSRNLRIWEDISDHVHFPPGAQHGSVARIPLERLESLL
jgi:hypothetical protein